MTRNEKQVLEVLATVTNRSVESIERGQNLSVDLGLDSAKGLEFMLELETNANIVIPDEDAARLVTVGDILDYVKNMDTEREKV